MTYNVIFPSIHQIYLINSDLRFTIDGKIIKTCSDIISAYNERFKIDSLFQVPLVLERRFYLFGCRFPPTLCPLIFNKSFINYFFILDIVDTFYKTNLIKFSNEPFEDLNSYIMTLYISHSENIILDTTFLNSFVFENLHNIHAMCSVGSISIDLFTSLKKLSNINFVTIHFRKLIHRNGIEWINGINRDVHVNLSNLSEFS